LSSSLSPPLPSPWPSVIVDAFFNSSCIHALCPTTHTRTHMHRHSTPHTIYTPSQALGQAAETPPCARARSLSLIQSLHHSRTHTHIYTHRDTHTHKPTTWDSWGMSAARLWMVKYQPCHWSGGASLLASLTFSFLVGVSVCVCEFWDEERRRGDYCCILTIAHARAHTHAHTHTGTILAGIRSDRPTTIFIGVLQVCVCDWVCVCMYVYLDDKYSRNFIKHSHTHTSIYIYTHTVRLANRRLDLEHDLGLPFN
jgi:hypothetical protein